MTNNEILNDALSEIRRLRIELQATRWAMWHCIDAWHQERPWGDGFGGIDVHETDVCIALVKQGRQIENDRESKGLNDPMSIEVRILDFIGDRA